MAVGGAVWGGCPGDGDECVIMEVRASSGWDLSSFCFLQLLWAPGGRRESEEEMKMS